VQAVLRLGDGGGQHRLSVRQALPPRGVLGGGGVGGGGDGRRLCGMC
jgi:hypothetical protein